MNHLAKAVVLSLGLTAMVGLTACQSSSATAPGTAHQLPEHPKHHRKPFDGDFKRKHQLTDAERTQKRAEMEQRHTERKAHFEALQKACEGKAGQNISVTIGEKTVEGTCEVHFRPNKPQPAQPL